MGCYLMLFSNGENYSTWNGFMELIYYARHREINVPNTQRKNLIHTVKVICVIYFSNNKEYETISISFSYQNQLNSKLVNLSINKPLANIIPNSRTESAICCFLFQMTRNMKPLLFCSHVGTYRIFVQLQTELKIASCNHILLRRSSP